MKPRSIFKEILSRIQEPRKFIQVLLGPRQIGKTTLALQVENEVKMPTYYISADTVALEDSSWIQMQWDIARQKMKNQKQGLLIVDEIQKIPHWSEVIKKLWDEDSRNQINLKVILLGSSPWLMQKGLQESLAGRFEIIPITHWDYEEMKDFFGWDLNHFIYFGGYPGPVEFANQKEYSRWLNYINDSLIETTISRDILLMTQINKPILLRRLFQLACNYSSQILSYQKMLGQLQDAGNTTTLAHYLELLSGAGLITGINKFSNQKVRSKASSPKLMVYNTALMSAQSSKSFNEAIEDKAFWGRLTESAIGAHFLNKIRGTRIELFYWRERNEEVDFILRKGTFITAIEVKTLYKKETFSGMKTFSEKFKPKRMLIIGNQGITLEEFFKESIYSWVE
jgi:predicted AAA+ superfamily ATPase